MKFIHIADMHFDSPYLNLSDKENMGEQRRLEQRRVLKKIIEYIKKNNVELFFISGDLYEHKYIRKSTIEYINSLFSEIPNTKIFISPGNHDPYIKESMYNNFKWNDNVKIFNGKIEKVIIGDVNIYGFGFEDFYCYECGLDGLEIDNNETNILVLHGALDGTTIEDKQYNSINSKDLKIKDFDYVALGHIHKPMYETNIVYPGSTIAHGFDELGPHGMIVGNIENGEITKEFIELDEKEFKEKVIDISEILYKEDLITEINNIYIPENEFIKIILAGKRNFDINILQILKLLDSNRILKIKDNTKVNFEIEDLINYSTLKGIFVDKLSKKMINSEENSRDNRIMSKALEIGLDILE